MCTRTHARAAYLYFSHSDMTFSLSGFYGAELWEQIKVAEEALRVRAYVPRAEHVYTPASLAEHATRYSPPAKHATHYAMRAQRVTLRDAGIARHTPCAACETRHMLSPRRRARLHRRPNECTRVPCDRRALA